MAAALSKADARAVKVITSGEAEQARVTALKQFGMFFETSVSPAQWTTTVGSLTGHPAAFLVVMFYGVFWFVFEPTTFDWHVIATLIVWTLAVHAKLDELLKATRHARTELASIDEREPEVIENIRDRERREAQTK